VKGWKGGCGSGGGPRVGCSLIKNEADGCGVVSIPNSGDRGLSSCIGSCCHEDDIVFEFLGVAFVEESNVNGS